MAEKRKVRKTGEYRQDETSAGEKNTQKRGIRLQSIQAVRLTDFNLRYEVCELSAIAAIATAKRLMCAKVFRFVTEDMFLTHIRSCPVFLKREL